jgi:hypothetical protein
MVEFASLNILENPSRPRVKFPGLRNFSANFGVNLTLAKSVIWSSSR